jgi:serine/threonine protein kinase
MIQTGKVLQQRYHIDRQIGQGGMGAVYIATDQRFGSVVAIKETLLMDDGYRKAIEREARLLNSLKHSALPRVSDHFLEDNGQFLVMEYVPGDDFGVKMENGHEPFAVEDVLRWADQLLDALDFLHNQTIPVIHRDIKPQNLKLNARGQIILLDFGLAKGNPTDAGHHTAATSIFGYSKNYASLEQIQGTGTDPRSDLYSLAATLYHLLTGIPPADALTRAMSVLSRQPDPLRPADLVREDIPHGVAVILQRAMDLNAGLRPSSAREMRQMLLDHEQFANEAYPAEDAAFAGGPTIFEQKTRLMQGNTRQVGDNQTDVKTEIMTPYISEETRVASGKENKRKRSTIPLAAAAAVVVAASALGGTYLMRPDIFESAQPASQSAPAVVADQPAEAPLPPASESNANVEGSAGVAANTAVANRVESTQAVKPADNTRASRAASAQKRTPTGSEDVTINGDTIMVGNMRIRNGVIETPNTYIDENGIRRKIPTPVIPKFPDFSGEQLRTMTPEQREKLRILMENQRRNTTPPTP